jgi:hypothetical protein
LGHDPGRQLVSAATNRSEDSHHAIHVILRRLERHRATPDGAWNTWLPRRSDVNRLPNCRIAVGEASGAPYLLLALLGLLRRLASRSLPQ